MLLLLLSKKRIDEHVAVAVVVADVVVIVVKKYEPSKWEIISNYLISIEIRMEDKQIIEF